jgi:threonine dehydratase
MRALREVIRPTTFIESSKLRDHIGLDITIATETFQHTGSFKFRAGYNLAFSAPNDHILTASSGNFGQAVAYACKLLGKGCTVVMPATSAQVKVEAVRGFGATVDLIDTKNVARNERVAQLAADMAEAYVASAYDDQFVIDGNASLGEEISERDLDIVVSPIGGGGLISGLITGLKRNGSNATVLGAEPLLGNDAARSLRAGRLIRNEQEPMTIADGARTLSLGRLNWPIIRDNVPEIIEIPEERIAEAVRLCFELANLKVEPTGALALGAVLTRPEFFSEKKTCLIVTGGNVDRKVYQQIIGGDSAGQAVNSVW